MSNNAYTPPRSNVADRYGSVSGAVSTGILEQLRRSRIWVLIIAIALLIAALFTMIAGAAMIGGSSFMTASPEMQAMGNPGMLKGLGIVYFLMSVLFYLIPSILLFRFAGGISKAVNSADAFETEEALRKQAGFWKYVGVFTLILLVISVIGIVAAIAVPALMMGGTAVTP